MTAPTDTVRSGRRTVDVPLRVAAIGSLVLAVPGLLGFLVLLWIAFSGSWEAENVAGGLKILVRLLLPALPLVGYYLLGGYWRTLLRASPARRPRQF
jgi:hypothetical protein